jgi:uncharacterized phage-associated protein
MPKDLISPAEIAKYFLIRAEKDGELITPLKMQKLVYFAYVFFLVSKEGKEKLFNEPIQAWPAGPVVPSLYQELKKYGSSPINIEDFVDINEEEFLKSNRSEIIEVLDKTYENCEKWTAFELVTLTHQEKGWLEARKGLQPYEKTSNIISDKDILAQHLK